MIFRYFKGIIMKYLLTLLLCLFALLTQAQKYEFHSDDTYQIKKNGNLVIKSDGAEVTIKGTEREDAWVKIDRIVDFRGTKSSDKEFKVEVREEDGDILIREIRGSNSYSMGYTKEDYKIQIELPKDSNLKLNGDDGAFFISDLTGKIKIDLDDSEARLVNCISSENRINMDDSDFRMSGGRGELILGLDDSEVIIENGEFETAFIDFDDSEIEFQTSLADNGKYKFSGEGEIDFLISGGGGIIEVRHDDSEIRTTEGFEALEQREGYLRFRTGNGKAQVDFNVEDSEIDLVKK